MANILIADDSPFIRTAYKRVLETQADFVVASVCEDGLEAVNQCSEVQIDVAVLDIRMPRLDGISASKTIREKNPEISIVIVSAFDDWSYVKDLIETDSKAKAYILKNSLDDRINSFSVNSKEILISSFTLLDAVEKLELVKSRSEAKRLIKSNGIKINDKNFNNIDFSLSDYISKKEIKISVGKKKIGIIKII